MINAKINLALIFTATCTLPLDQRKSNCIAISCNGLNTEQVLHKIPVGAGILCFPRPPFSARKRKPFKISFHKTKVQKHQFPNLAQQNYILNLSEIYTTLTNMAHSLNHHQPNFQALQHHEKVQNYLLIFSL